MYRCVGTVPGKQMGNHGALGEQEQGEEHREEDRKFKRKVFQDSVNPLNAPNQQA